jgi:hypothetical protein
VPLSPYVLEQWSGLGQKLRELRRSPSWWREEGTDVGYKDIKKAPPPSVVDLFGDSTGLLWVAIHVADARWKEAMGTVSGMYGRRTTGVADPLKYQDTIVDVIDPRDNRLVTSQKFDEQLRFVGETGFAYGYRLDQAGVPSTCTGLRLQR